MKKLKDLVDEQPHVHQQSNYSNEDLMFKLFMIMRFKMVKILLMEQQANL